MILDIKLPGTPSHNTPPINIPTKKTNNNEDCESNIYETISNLFDPSKKSPPNSWTNRLFTRYEQSLFKIEGSL